MIGFLFSVWIIASLFGSVEALLILFRNPNLPFIDSLLIFLYCWIGYSIIPVVAAFLWQKIRQGKPALSSAHVVGLVVFTFVAINSAPSGLRLWGLASASVIYGLPAGWIAFQICRWIPLLSNRMLWNILNAFSLFLVVLTLFLFSREPASVASADESHSNIVLISVDTLRADRLGCYGYLKAITPNIDRLAKQSIVFDQAFSHVPLTGPSHTTMLTGLYHETHGAISNSHKLKEQTFTLPEILASSGYRTAAIVSGWPLKDSESGLARRFQFYDDDFSNVKIFPDILIKVPLIRLVSQIAKGFGYQHDSLRRDGALTTDRALKWLHESHHRPFFLFIHYYDPHGPYIPPPRFNHLHDPDFKGNVPPFDNSLPSDVLRPMISNPRTVEHIKSQYDDVLSYLDEQLGRFLRELDASYPNTILIFTADHGESFTEHHEYFNHGEYLYDTCLRVPFMIRLPNQSFAGSRRKTQIRLIDLAPTVLELANVKRRNRMDGRSLMPVISGTDEQDRPLFASLHAGIFEDRRSRYAFRYRGYKLIWNFDAREDLNREPAFEEFYDVTQDTGETKNLISENPEKLHPMEEILRQWVPGYGKVIPELNEEQKEKLHALGYL